MRCDSPSLISDLISQPSSPILMATFTSPPSSKTLSPGVPSANPTAQHTSESSP